MWAHFYSIAPGMFSQIILIKNMSFACLIVLKDTGCALAENHCKMLITLDLLGTELYLYVQLVKIPFFINVVLSTKILEFLVQNILERRRGKFII